MDNIIQWIITQAIEWKSKSARGIIGTECPDVSEHYLPRRKLGALAEEVGEQS